MSAWGFGDPDSFTSYESMEGPDDCEDDVVNATAVPVSTSPLLALATALYSYSVSVERPSTVRWNVPVDERVSAAVAFQELAPGSRYWKLTSARDARPRSSSVPWSVASDSVTDVGESVTTCGSVSAVGSSGVTTVPSSRSS